MAVAAFQSAHEQGVYGLVNGLGSIAVRTLFQPFEEAAFVAFSKEQGAQAAPKAQACPGTCAAHAAAVCISVLPLCIAGQTSGGPATLQRQARLLAVLVRCITMVGLLGAAFGPAYSHLALLLLYSRRWADTEASLALGAYSLYLALLAANGTLEAFVHSVADEHQLHASNVALVGFTATHVALSVGAVRAGGACGLVLADGANMLLRIAYCLAFTRRRFVPAVPGFHLRQLLPSRHTATALAAAAAATGAARLALFPDSSFVVQLARQRGITLVPAALGKRLAAQPFAVMAAAHIGVGAACLAGVVAAVLRNEHSVLSEFRQLRKGAKGS